MLFVDPHIKVRIEGRDPFDHSKRMNWCGHHVGQYGLQWRFHHYGDGGRITYTEWLFSREEDAAHFALKFL